MRGFFLASGLDDAPVLGGSVFMNFLKIPGKQVCLSYRGPHLGRLYRALEIFIQAYMLFGDPNPALSKILRKGYITPPRQQDTEKTCRFPGVLGV
jgi:hypothetical protein